MYCHRECCVRWWVIFRVFRDKKILSILEKNYRMNILAPDIHIF